MRLRSERLFPVRADYSELWSAFHAALGRVYRATQGDILFMYTVGVAEDEDTRYEPFCAERMPTAPNRDAGAEPEALHRNVRRENDALVGGAPQFGVIARLSLDYKGGRPMFELTLEEARVDRLEEVLAFVDGHLEAADCPMRTQMQIDMAVEEIYVNIASYAYAPGTGPATIRMSVEGGVAEITFVDSGVPFDPLAKPDPDVTLSAEARQIGGLGIYMVKKSMDVVEYAHSGGRNILALRKRL